MTLGTRYDGTSKWDRVNDPNKTRLVEYEFVSETDEIGRDRATQQSTVLCSVMRRGWDTTNTQRDGTQRMHNLGLRKNTLLLIPLNQKTETVYSYRTRKLVISVSVMRGFQCKTMRQMQKKRDKRDKIRDKWDKIKDNETKDQIVSSLSFILFHSYFLIHNVSLKRLHSSWLGYTDKFITIIHID